MRRLFLKIVIFSIMLLNAAEGMAQAKKQTALSPAKPSAELALDYYLYLCRTVQSFHVQPTNASRLFAYTGLVLYETIIPQFPEYHTMVGQLTNLQDLPKPPQETWHAEVAAAGALNAFFRTMLQSEFQLSKDGYTQMILKRPLDTLQNKFELKLRKAYPKEEEYKRSVAFGEEIAQAIYEYSKTDGGFRDSIESLQKDFSHYESPQGATWQDTLTKNYYSLQPTWGQNRTFVKMIDKIATAAQPYPYSTDPKSKFYQEALEVYEFCRNQNFEYKAIAEYWKDNAGASFTPPGHSICILTQVLTDKKATLDFTAYAYCKLGIALSDAFVCCWKTKYETNQIRPETYIKQNIDPRFKPLFQTPPFPEYTSGHSVQSGAAAAVLTDLFGSEYAFTDHTLDLIPYNGSTVRYLVNRSFKNFNEFAQESSLSRMYAGIHFRQACEMGVLQGRVIGSEVNNLQWKN
ncbi:MAG: vanadium-dependent haloperoxidase [Spirosomataceae bacterium]